MRRRYLTEDEVRALGTMYDVGNWLSRRHEPRGRANATFLLAAETGDYVLRRSNARKTLPGIRFEAELINYLRGRGYPAPELIPGRNGGGFVELNGSLYLLSRFIRGKPYDPDNPAHLKEAARGLGWYHGLARDFPGASYRRAPPVMAQLDAVGKEQYAEIGRFGSRLLGGEEQKRLADTLEYVGSRTRDILIRLSELHQRLPALIIHASYGRSALIFGDGLLSGVVDFDRATHDIRALDLAYSIKTFCSVHRDFRRERQVALDLDCCRSFVGSYRDVEPLPDGEAEALPLVFEARHCVKISGVCSGFLSRNAAQPREERHMRKLLSLKLERERAWLEWLDRHEGELASAFSAG